MPNPHLTATRDPWKGSSTPTPTYGGSYGREERAFQGESSVSHPVYDSGRGNGNDGRGDGIGVNTINQVIENPVTVDTTPTSTKPNSVTNVYGEEVDLTNISDDIWNLAKQAADPITNPGYALSYEGQLLKDRGILPGSDRWVAHFGIPQIVTTSGRTGKPILSTEGDKPIMSGQGKYLMDQYDDSKTYEENIDYYYEMREAEEAQQPDKDPNYGYDYGYGSGTSYAGSFSYPGFPQVASAQDRHKYHLDRLYKGRTQPGQEVQKMLASNQKIEAANILSRLSQDAQAFEMDPKRRGILAVLQA